MPAAKLNAAADLCIEATGAIDEALSCADESAAYYEPMVVMAKAVAALASALTIALGELHRVDQRDEGD